MKAAELFKKGHVMKTLPLILATVLQFTCLMAVFAESHGGITSGRAVYQDCRVHTRTGPDWSEHRMACGDDRQTGYFQVARIKGQPPSRLTFGNGGLWGGFYSLPVDLLDPIWVAWQVDRRPHQEQTWEAGDTLAINRDQAQVKEFLEQVRTGLGLTYRLGKHAPARHVGLRGSAAAIDDFLSR